MKKLVLLLCCAAVLSGPAAFGVDFSLSAGAGGLLGYTFTRYTLEAGTRDGGAIESHQSMDRFDYGGLLFFDLGFSGPPLWVPRGAEFSVLFQWGRNSYRETMDKNAAMVSDTKGTGTEMSLGFSLLAKWPFTIKERFILSPMAGVEYQIALVEWRKPDGGLSYDRPKGNLAEDRDKNGNSYPLSVWNSFWIDIGAGLDYALTERLYLRGEVLFGFRLQTDYETGALEMTKKQFDAPDPSLTGLTGGPRVKIAAGYRFK